jgi:hypothetical protein
MTSKRKNDFTHSDALDQELQVNDFVAYPSSSGLGRNQLKIGKIVAMTPKMVKVVHVNKRLYEARITTRYSRDCVKIDEQLVTVYLLKNGFQNDNR